MPKDFSASIDTSYTQALKAKRKAQRNARFDKNNSFNFNSQFSPFHPSSSDTDNNRPTISLPIESIDTPSIVNRAEDGIIKNKPKIPSDLLNQIKIGSPKVINTIKNKPKIPSELLNQIKIGSPKVINAIKNKPKVPSELLEQIKIGSPKVINAIKNKPKVPSDLLNQIKSTSPKAIRSNNMIESLIFTKNDPQFGIKVHSPEITKGTAKIYDYHVKNEPKQGKINKALSKPSVIEPLLAAAVGIPLGYEGYKLIKRLKEKKKKEKKNNSK